MLPMSKLLVLYPDYGQSLWWREKHFVAVEPDFLPFSLYGIVSDFEVSWEKFENLSVTDDSVHDRRKSIIQYGQAVGGCIALWAKYHHDADTIFELGSSVHCTTSDYTDIEQSYTPHSALAYTKYHARCHQWVLDNFDDVAKMYNSWVAQWGQDNSRQPSSLCTDCT